MALMCKKGFLEEDSSVMVAASDTLMLSSMAACVMAPFTVTDRLLFSGLKSTGVARLILLVFLANPFVPFDIFFCSWTGVEARLWLRVFLVATVSVGVVATLVLRFFFTWLSLSVPQKGFLCI